MRYLFLLALVAAGLLYGCGHADMDPQVVEKPNHDPAAVPAKE